MYGSYWGHRGMFGTGGFSNMNYIGSSLGFWLLIGFLVLVTVTIVLLLVGARKKHAHTNGGAEALDSIKRRYAKGELTHEDFQRMKEDLT